MVRASTASTSEARNAAVVAGQISVRLVVMQSLRFERVKACGPAFGPSPA
jgi:hypothetical protein